MKRPLLVSIPELTLPTILSRLKRDCFQELTRTSFFQSRVFVALRKCFALAACFRRYFKHRINAVSYEACGRVLRWSRDPRCITYAMLRRTTFTLRKLDGSWLVLRWLRGMCSLQSLRNRRHCTKQIPKT